MMQALCSRNKEEEWKQSGGQGTREMVTWSEGQVLGFWASEDQEEEFKLE